MGNDASRVTVVCAQRVPGSSPGRGEEKDGSYTVTYVRRAREQTLPKVNLPTGRPTD